VVNADVAGFYRVFAGHMPFKRAIDTGLIRLNGMPSLVRGFPDWFAWSPFAQLVSQVSRHGSRSAATSRGTSAVNTNARSTR
jgi:hypothetical protein